MRHGTPQLGALMAFTFVLASPAGHAWALPPLPSQMLSGPGMSAAGEALLGAAGQDVVAANVIQGHGGPVVLYMRPKPDAAGEVCTQQYLRVYLDPDIGIVNPEDIVQAVAGHQTSVQLANLDNQYRRARSAEDCRSNLSAAWTFAPDAGTFVRVKTVLDDLRAKLAAGQTATGYSCWTVVSDGNDRPCTDAEAELKTFLSLNMRIIFWADKSTAQVSSERGQNVTLQVHFKGELADTLKLVNDPFLFE